MTGTGLRFTTSDDVRIAYDDEGDGAAVVLVHGYSSRRAHWEYQRSALLDAGYRVIGVDLRCHGDSDRPAHGQTINRLGQDVRELIDHLDVEDVTLLCHSMGTSVALGMHSISGFRGIRRFVAVDQSPKIINDDEWGWGVRGITWDNLMDAVHWRIKWSNEELEPPLPPDSLMALEPWDDYPHDEVLKLLVDHFVSDWRDQLPRIPVPTWVVTSRFTNYYHLEGMEWFADQLPDGRLSVFEHSGHNIFVTEPDAFNKQLLDFIAST